jgi:chloride channel 3/4/5
VQRFRRDNLAAHGVAEAIVLATLTAFVGYWNKFLRIDMSESLEILFHECEGGGDYDSLCQSSAQWRMVNSLLIATVLRAALVVLSYGCKVPAGIFVPSMAIGATFGRMVGILVKALYTAFPHASIFSACQPDVPCITPGTYAFLGAAAALAGVTRITVAVVVIMFELTGALTYILPTMFVVMITKGVGDLYGKGGISDQTIRFQGYPFLDKDEHVFGLPVADIMTRGPAVLYGAGMPLAEVEQRLASGPYKGLPVVRSAEDPTLLGYAGKTEMRYAIAKARRARSTLAPTTLCCFTSEADNDEASGLGVHPLAQHPPTPIVSTFETMEPNNGKDDEHQGLMGGQDSDDEHDSLGEAGGGIDGEGDDDVLELGGWMEQVSKSTHACHALADDAAQTPLCVQPSMPLEVVMDLFKKMGPRVIIVTRLGRVVGLVTVKDVLKHHAATEHAAAVAASAARDVRSGPGLPSAAAVPQDGFGGDLELALSDLYTWFLTYARTLAPIAAKVRGWFPANGAGRSAARPQAPPGYSRPSRQAEAADEDEQREQFVLAGEGDE